MGYKLKTLSRVSSNSGKAKSYPSGGVACFVSASARIAQCLADLAAFSASGGPLHMFLPLRAVGMAEEADGNPPVTRG